MSEHAARSRAELVEHLKEQGSIRSARIEAAFRRVPRHAFVPHVSVEEAYADRPIALKRERNVPISSSSQPAMMALMLEALDPRPGERILEIGAGSGYNAALLASLVGPDGFVATIDVEADLLRAARERLDACGWSGVKTICGDGTFGDPADAPFDAIEASVAVADIPVAWIDQLRPGGRLVVPLAIRLSQKVIAFERCGERLVSRIVMDGAFMMLRGLHAAAYERRTEFGEPEIVLQTLDAAPVDRNGLVAAFALPPLTVVPPRSFDAAEVWGSLALWLDLHEPAVCRLSAHSATPARADIPTLLSALDADRGIAATIGVYSGGEAAFFDRAPDDRRVYVRSFGAGRTCANRLLGAVERWDAAGRPANGDLRVEIVPRGDRAARRGRGPTPETWATLERAACDIEIRWCAPHGRAPSQ